MNQKVLVVAAHPDDEVLGMGGTLLRLAKQERVQIHVLFLSLGEASRGEAIADEKLRASQARFVANKIGMEIYQLGDFPDNAFDSVPLLQIAKTVERYIKQINPKIVYTHHHGDLNIDHRLTFQAVMTACRPGKTSVEKIYSFEVLSSTEWQAKTTASIFLPNYYVDIESFVKSKVELMKVYAREVSSYPFPRSREGIITLARYRGIESGLKFAEAFEMVRSVRSQIPPK